MSTTTNGTQAIVTDDLAASACEVVNSVRHNTRHPFLFDAKLGDANTGPMPDPAIAAILDAPKGTIGYWLNPIIKALKDADQQLGSPLHQIAQRTNDVIAKAAIINRQNRRPPLYAEPTIRVLIELGFATAKDAPLIRAAGYVNPPSVVPASHDIDEIMKDIAVNMARARDPHSPEDILQSLRHRQDDLANWPELDLELFIRRVGGLLPDDQGLYQPDQPWGTLIRPSQLVAKTVLHILKRDQRPRSAPYLIDETRRLVGLHLPDGYNLPNAVHHFAYHSDEVTLQGRSTFGLRKWGTTRNVPNAPNVNEVPTTTGDHIYVFLMEHGPSNINDAIEHALRTVGTERRTIQDVINHDNAQRFVRLPDRRLAANPFHKGLNPIATTLTVVPDGQQSRLGPILRQSELLWITHYVQALNKLAPPLPTRAALTGPRAAGFALDEPIEIVVVVDDRDRPDLESQLARAAAVASESVPSVQPQISILSVEQWTERMDGEPPTAHHNVWLAPGATP
ncbi:MAG: hypothetical protein OXF79_16725 [Chloroflexi bacterium]|nr:hypothetical protein [Chloroflexota bacterium]